MTRNRRSWGGIALIIVGAGLLLDHLGIFDFGDLTAVLWPLALVLLGVKLVMGNRTAGSHSAGDHPAGDRSAAGPSATAGGDGPTGSAAGSTAAGDGLDESSIFGDISIRVQSAAFTGGSVSATFGDTKLDLTTIALAEGEQFLRVNGVFGDTKVLLPAGIAVSVSARTTLGDVAVLGEKRDGISPSAHIESPGYTEASRRLRIVVSQVLGDVKVEMPLTI